MSDAKTIRLGLQPYLPILRWALAVAIGIALNASPARAQEPDPEVPRESDVVEWYTVQSGDTLAGITLRFLGTDRLWPENHRLNPHIRNPNLLRIGDRLLIITHRETEERSAELVGLSPRVDKRLVARGGWEEAKLSDRLGSGDGIQTLRRASAELAFDDGTSLLVSEDSVVYLRRIGRRLTGVSEETIEVEQGGADLVAAPRRADSSEIEVIVGNTTARPRAGRTGRLNSRVQRAGGPSGAAAELAVYEGSSAVAAAGETVNVPAGMGTVVPEDGPPGAPERLLRAPQTFAPRSGERFGFNNPTFAWSAVEGAVAYELEICRDPQCGTLIDKIGGLTTPSSRPEVLPTGDLYWRVRALSASGLDGYPSRAARFVIGGGADLAPPVVALVVEAPGRATDGVVYLAPGGGIRPAPIDDESGVAEVRYRWNQGPWRGWSSGVLTPPSGAKENLLEVLARDGAGRESVPLVVEVQRLEEPPPVPILRFVVKERARSDS